MPFTDLVVVSVVCWRDFNKTRSKLHIDVLVGDDLNLATDYRQYDFFADQIFIAFVVWVYHDGGVAEVGFRTRGRNNDIRQILALICFVAARLARIFARV